MRVNYESQRASFAVYEKTLISCSRKAARADDKTSHLKLRVEEL